MCMGSQKPPKAKEPLPPPPPPPPAPEAPPAPPVQSGREAEETSTRNKKTGTSSLRIDLNLGGGGTGLNIPA